MLTYLLLTTLVVLCQGTLVAGDNATDTHSGPMLFKIGLLIPWHGSYDGFSGLTSASAISLAIEDIYMDSSLRHRMKFSVDSYDSGCNSKVSSGHAVGLLVNEGVDAFIGPPCSSACWSVAQLASYYDKPIISWFATDPDFNDKSMYTTLGRTLGPFNRVGYFMVELLTHYNWKRAVVISSDYNLWSDAGKAIRLVFDQHNITIAYQVSYGLDQATDSYIRSVLTKTTEEGRIVILLVPKADRRRFILSAHDLGMTGGDYVFFTVDMLPSDDMLSPADVYGGVDGRDEEAREAFEAVFHITLAAQTSAKTENFQEEVARRMRLPPWSAYIPEDIDMSREYMHGDLYSAFLYDAMQLYAIAINNSLNKGMNPRSGRVIATNMRGQKFKGMTGNVVIDDNGDREPDYWVTDMLPDGSFVTIAEIINHEDGYREFRSEVLPPRWPGGRIGRSYAPPDTPPCGFRDDLCHNNTESVWIVVLVIVLVCLAVAAITSLVVWLYRKQKFESSLLELSWKIKWEDLEPLQDVKRPRDAERDEAIGSSSETGDKHVESEKSEAVHFDARAYKGIAVTVKRLKKGHLQISRQVLVEFNQMNDISHENLNKFVGACVEPPNICLLWHYCPKGSLWDVLAEDNIKLDHTFKMSFMSDLAKGMHYIHSSHLISHGNLKSSNCLLDSKWTLKITDYGLPSVLASQDIRDADQHFYKQKVWTAPEILRENFPPPKGTQKGDVYSFAIVCYEILMRSAPYSFGKMTPRDVVNRVRNGESVPVRPILPEVSDLGFQLLDLIKACWDEDPSNRPSFQSVRASLRKITGGEINIMDSVLKMMEKYATNLEEIVAGRTRDLMDEKKRSDRLLYRMLPTSVAEQLKGGMYVQPEYYDQCTIYFSDVVGFTAIASDSSPLQIVNFLNDLYTCFDDVIAKYDVYKVETIGDAYMVVSGVPVRNGHRHATEIANVSLDLLSAVTHFRIRHRPYQQLQLRIGLHSGPCVAGVVGNTMPRYCLFGDTVNWASKMESSGKALRIHISKATYTALVQHGGYVMSPRTETSVWNKGPQTSYWLHGKNGYNKALPVFDREPSVPKANTGVTSGSLETTTSQSSKEDITGVLPEVDT